MRRRAPASSAPRARVGRGAGGCRPAAARRRPRRRGRRGRDERAQLILDDADAATQVQAQVERHLLVARATRVQALAGRPDALHELALHEGVHVLVARPTRTSDRLPRLRAVPSGRDRAPAVRRATARPHAATLRTTRDCPRRRPRRGDGRRQTTRRRRTRRDREHSRIGQTTSSTSLTHLMSASGIGRRPS